MARKPPPRSKTKSKTKSKAGTASVAKAPRKPTAAKAKGKAMAEAKVVKGATPVLDDMIDAAAKALALKCSPAWMPSIRANLQVILRQAALVDAFVLPDEIEPAPVFEA